MDGRARIAWNLRHLRTSKGITQEVLAVDADVDRTYISGIEQGSFNPTIDILDRLAGALEVDVMEFLAPLRDDAKAVPPLTAGRKPKPRQR